MASRHMAAGDNEEREDNKTDGTLEKAAAGVRLVEALVARVPGFRRPAPARRKGDHHAVPRLRRSDVRSHLLHDAHGLVAQDVACVEKGIENLVEVQVRAAEARGQWS
ncbi:hypothetical protein GCM10010343_14210 [Streptomyces avidinii]|nr:hypothetical protein GCM10010343_14210 [Streptomyces avidinii]